MMGHYWAARDPYLADGHHYLAAFRAAVDHYLAAMGHYLADVGLNRGSN